MKSDNFVASHLRVDEKVNSAEGSELGASKHTQESVGLSFGV